MQLLEEKIKFLKSPEAELYLNKFKGKTFVVKYGGAALERDDLMPDFLRDIAAIHKAGIHLILIHGGGRLLSRYMREAGLEVEFVGGMRRTTMSVIPIARHAFGDLNTKIVETLSSFDVKVNAVHGEEFCLAKALAGHYDKARSENNFVALAQDFLMDKLEDTSNCIPVITSLGRDLERPDFIYNINADQVAVTLASKLKAEKVIFISDVNGIYREPDNPASHISHITKTGIAELIKDGTLSGGMRMKIEMSLLAMEQGVSKVHFLNGELNHSLIKEVFTHKGIGTEIVLED